MVFSNFCYFVFFSEQFRVPSGFPGLHFSMLFWTLILLCFLFCFFTSFKKRRNMKSAQNIAPVHRFRTSPCWKNRAQLWRIHRMFIHFSPKNDGKSSPKVRKKRFSREIATTKIDSWRPFWGQGFIFGRFGDPGGDPKIVKNQRPFLSKGVLGAIW